MRHQRATRLDRAVGELADRQQGAVAWSQLREIGMSASAVQRRIERGWLRPVHRGVYLVGHAVPAPYARQMSAVLACGPGSAVSHRSAAAILGLLPYPASADVWITAPAGDHRKRPGIRIHSTTRLRAADVVLRSGVPHTASPRTLVDLGATVSLYPLERAVAEALARRLVTRESLRRQLLLDRGRRGVGRLRRLLDLEEPPAFTRSEAERRFLRLVRDVGLPEPEANVRVGRWEVDFLWRAQRVVVEIDGRAYHSSGWSFRRDRERSNELQLAGYTVLRLTWLELTRHPVAVHQRVRAALSKSRVGR